MSRKRMVIHAESDPIGTDGTEADMQCWVRVTQMLLQARARRQARLASAGLALSEAPELEASTNEYVKSKQ